MAVNRFADSSNIGDMQLHLLFHHIHTCTMLYILTLKLHSINQHESTAAA